MNSIWDRLVLDEGEPRFRAAGKITVAEASLRLEAGKGLRSLGLPPTDLLAVLGFIALDREESLGPPLVQQPPRHPRLEASLNETELSEVFSGSDRPARLALAAGLLQIHDFWDSSHEAAQAADDLGEQLFSAYWHGIAHRREPDAGNAAYWFRKVGRHHIFPTLCEAARRLLKEHEDDRLTARLVGQGGWNPMAMIDLCTEARPGTPQEFLARRLQRLEMHLLLDATASSLTKSAPS
jgi:hypothetical protein